MGREDRAEVNRKPVDATRKIGSTSSSSRRRRRHGRPDGRCRADLTGSHADAALLIGEPRRHSAGHAIKPKVTESDFKTAIIVSLAQCKIRLYKGAKLVKTYRCAPGRPAFPTPTGDFEVVTKLANAPWINPASIGPRTCSEHPARPLQSHGRTQDRHQPPRHLHARDSAERVRQHRDTREPRLHAHDAQRRA